MSDRHAHRHDHETADRHLHERAGERRPQEALAHKGDEHELARHDGVGQLEGLVDVADQKGSVCAAPPRKAPALASRLQGASPARQAFAEPLERLLRDGAADGSLRASDPRETATAPLNLTKWTYVHLRGGSRWSARRALGHARAGRAGGWPRQPRPLPATSAPPRVGDSLRRRGDRRLRLEPHVEGGHFPETFRHPADDGRGAMTSILYLLAKGETSAWHRVDAAEVWHFHAGAALVLAISADGRIADRHRLGVDLAAGELPQIVVPENAWQGPAAPAPGPWSAPPWDRPSNRPDSSLRQPAGNPAPSPSRRLPTACTLARLGSGFPTP